MARLRAFLQSLTTGEAGFMNACVGSTAFAFALYKHNREQRVALEAEEEAHGTLASTADRTTGAIRAKAMASRVKEHGYLHSRHATVLVRRGRHGYF